MNYLDIALSWHRNGFNILPTTDNKRPAVASWKKWQTEPQTEEEVREIFKKDCKGIALICGINGVEVIDIDIKADPDGEIVKQVTAELKKEPFNLIKDYAYQTTPSGGAHILYRLSGQPPGNNPKLAVKNGKAIIETRGSGGYVLIAPTPGYKMFREDSLVNSSLTSEERDGLMLLCGSFNVDPPQGFKEYTPTGTTKQEQSTEDNRPGTQFNRDHGRDEVISLLEKHGWQVSHEYKNQVHMVRPGKSIRDGYSGNWDETHHKFYCHTPNAHPLQSDTAYSPFALLVALEYGGDWKAAARAVAPLDAGTLTVEKRVERGNDKWAGKVWVYNPYEDDGNDADDTILEYIDKGQHYEILGPGGGLSIGGEMKSRKSMLIRTIAAAGVAQKPLLGFNWKVTPRKILIFDTEQAKKWIKKGGRQLTRMLGTKDWADVIELHYIRELSHRDRLDFVEETLYLARSKGKVDMVVLDGIVDLVTNFNDIDQSYAVYDRIVAMQQEAAFAGVIHLNRGKDSQWERGHLGKIWAEKSEAILRVTYDDGQKLSNVKCYRSRDLPFPEFDFGQDDRGLVVPASSLIGKLLNV